MPSKSVTPRKLAGGAIGKSFRRQLEILVQEGGSQERFARQLWRGQSGANRAGRVSQWRSGRSMPNAESLALMSRAFDVSIDWLLGFDVPRRRSDREQVGSLADALSSHVVTTIASGAKISPEAFARAVGAVSSWRSPIALVSRRIEQKQKGKAAVGEMIENGCYVFSSGQLGATVIELDARAVLTRAVDLIAKAARDFETATLEERRAAVVARVRLLEGLTHHLGTDRQAGAQTVLLHAAMDPTSYDAQAALLDLEQEIGARIEGERIDAEIGEELTRAGIVAVTPDAHRKGVVAAAAAKVPRLPEPYARELHRSAKSDTGPSGRSKKTSPPRK